MSESHDDRGFLVFFDDQGARVVFDSEGNIVAAGTGWGGTSPKPVHLIVGSVMTDEVLRRDEVPFTRHTAVAALAGGRVMTTDAHGIWLLTPRPRGSASTAQQPAGDTKPVDRIGSIDATTLRSGVWNLDSGVLTSSSTSARLQFPIVPVEDRRDRGPRLDRHDLRPHPGHGVAWRRETAHRQRGMERPR